MAKSTRLSTVRLRESMMEEAKAEYKADKARHDAEIRSFLPDMTDDELYELATECGAEKGRTHCYKCEAWAIYCDRTQK